MTVCRFPWVELSFGVDWYPKFMEACTGKSFTPQVITELGDRLYSLMRSFWVREKGRWDRTMDTPPQRWFDDAFSEGEVAGCKLDRGKYDQLLSWYYEIRGWDQNGVPTRKTLEKLGLETL